MSEPETITQEPEKTEAAPPPTTRRGAVARQQLVADATPMQMLQIAVQNGTDLAMVEKLMDLQERWEKREAEKAFVKALAGFKAEPPEIIKNRKASFDSRRTGGHTEYAYATLDNVCDQIGPALSKHGLTFGWKIEQEPTIKVTCKLRHDMGHFEEVSMQAPRDESGQKNAIQMIASTVTYLQRYTLLAITGVAASNQDDDGAGSEPKPRPTRGDYVEEEDYQEADDGLAVRVPINNSGASNWPVWRAHLVARIDATSSEASLAALLKANEGALRNCERQAPVAHGNVKAAFERRLGELRNPQQPPPEQTDDQSGPGFRVTDNIDDKTVEYEEPEKAASAFLNLQRVAEKSGLDAIMALWENNTLPGDLRDAGFPEIAEKLHTERNAAEARINAKAKPEEKPIPAIAEKPKALGPMPKSKYESKKNGVEWDVFAKALIEHIGATPKDGLAAIREKYTRELGYFENYKPQTFDHIQGAFDAKN